MGKGGKKQPIVNSDSCIIIISVIWSWSIPDSFSLIHPLCAMPIIVLKNPFIPGGNSLWIIPLKSFGTGLDFSHLSIVSGSPLIQVQLPDVIFISRPINHSPYLLPTRFWIAFLINSHSCSVSITTRCLLWYLQRPLPVATLNQLTSF